MKPTTITERLSGLKHLVPRVEQREEADLYLQRARLAAAEERFDVARVFCEKALAVDPDHLAALLVLARIEEAAAGGQDRAIALYQKVIARSGYDGSNPCCTAAREALSLLGSAGKNQG
jgi:tetratricopeptide (TPR) repeat protein